MTVKESPVEAEGRMVRKELPEPNPPGKNKLDRPPPVASPRSPGKTPINERMRGRGLERPEDGVATLFLEGDFCRIFGRGGVG
jgi:hypothetical protein